ncbi:TetR/AcrR family transcriptional regulator [Streptomyces xylophagus]|uniref:TetR/AcrR family transcriptional regulator n=1 Tax=Streptomyces xylophagus TaxID=285514 RepID=UPI0005BA9F91|nr:TetR/AcrR family transcriptional regulator [Streptomyces xylophagus]
MQERAAHTRHALVRAAAAEFDSRGYEGASLSRISKGAGASMGALTFHFPTKRALADAVRRAGRSALDTVVRDVSSGVDAPLDALADLTFALIRLLEDDVVVRAAARLDRDGPHDGHEPRLILEWGWGLRALLARAAAAGELRPGVLPETAAVLLTRLVAGNGVEWAGSHPPRGARPDDVWELVLHGVTGRD